MQELKVKTSIPEGYEIDREKSTFEEIVFKKIEKKLPKTWKELRKINGYYVSSNSVVSEVSEALTKYCNSNIFPTEEEAKACLALAQLCQLRDRYNDGWKPDWESLSEKKFVIVYNNECIRTYDNQTYHRVLAFKTEELRDQFLENFKDLIEQAKPLL